MRKVQYKTGGYRLFGLCLNKNTLRIVAKWRIIYLAYSNNKYIKILCVLWAESETMEIKRKIYDKILEWKHSSNGKSALLIEGARRIGK